MQNTVGSNHHKKGKNSACSNIESECTYIGQGCQKAYFQTKNPDLGEFWRVLQWNVLVYYRAVWSILLILHSILGYYGYLVYFMAIWYICPVFGKLYQEKSGSPDIGMY
jgi:hypothetical protein